MLSISAVLGSVVAVLALGQAVTLAALIRWSRVTIDLNREQILVRWGWSIMAKQWEAPEEIEGGFGSNASQSAKTRRTERARSSVPLNGDCRRSFHSADPDVSPSPLLFACYRNRTFIRAVIGLVRSKLKELGSHDRASP